MKLKWSDLFAYGNIIHPIVRRPGLRTPRRLSDFGFNKNASFKKSGTEGHWKLIPQSALKNIDRIGRKARNIVDAYSVPFPLVPGGMFVPDTAVNKLVNELKLLKKNYNVEVDNLIRNYDRLIKEQIPAITAYVKRINPNMNADETIRRVLSCAPRADRLKNKFDISWSVFAVQAPVNKTVAEIIEKEEESVYKAVTELVNKIKEPIIEEIDRLMKLITVERSTTLSIKSINVGLAACDRFQTKNVFEDPFIRQSIESLRKLLKKMKNERENGITDKTISDLKDLQLEIERSDTKNQVNIALIKLRKFNKRKID